MIHLRSILVITLLNMMSLLSACHQQILPSIFAQLSPHFAYVTNEFGTGFLPGSVALCHVNGENGKLSDCEDSGYPYANFPGSLTIRTFDLPYAYISVPDILIPGGLFRCTINQDTGKFYDCREITAFDATQGGAGSMTFHEPHTLNATTLDAYVTTASNTVQKCVVDIKTGDFLSCVDSQFILPYTESAQSTLAVDISHTFDEKSLFYVATGVADPWYPYVVKCEIIENGLLQTPCDIEITGVEGDGTTGVSFFSFNPNSSEKFVFVMQGGYNFGGTGRSVTRCQVDSMTGSFSECVPNVSPMLFAPIDMTFIKVNNEIFMYSPNFNLRGLFTPPILNANSVTKCKFDSSTNTIVDCEDSGVGDTFTHPTRIAFY